MQEPKNLDYERLPESMEMDETDVSLRAYLAGLTDDHLAAYDPTWTDDDVIAWDGNFRNDGTLMLVCCERDVDVAEFRRVLEEHLQYRFGGSFGQAGQSADSAE